MSSVCRHWSKVIRLVACYVWVIVLDFMNVFQVRVFHVCVVNSVSVILLHEV
jgi:hypothetical protein